MHPYSPRLVRWADNLSQSQPRLLSLKEVLWRSLLHMAQTPVRRSARQLCRRTRSQGCTACMLCKTTAAQSIATGPFCREVVRQVSWALQLARLPTPCPQLTSLPTLGLCLCTPLQPLLRRLVLCPCTCGHLMREVQQCPLCPLGLTQRAGWTISLSSPGSCPGGQVCMHTRLQAWGHPKKPLLAHS